MEEKNNEIYDKAINLLNKGIKDQDKLRYALFLIKDIKSLPILVEYVDIACNKELLKSKYYHRVILLVSKQQYIKQLKYIKRIVTNEKFLHSKYSEQELRMLEDKTDETEYNIYFNLINKIEGEEIDLENDRNMKVLISGCKKNVVSSAMNEFKDGKCKIKI